MLGNLMASGANKAGGFVDPAAGDFDLASVFSQDRRTQNRKGHAAGTAPRQPGSEIVDLITMLLAKQS
jgi:hypothetical protein